MGTLKGTVTLLLIITNTVWHCLILFVLALIRIPLSGSARVRVEVWMDHWVIDPWVATNRWWFRFIKLCDVNVEWNDPLGLNRDSWYIVVSNHQTWTDILLLQTTLRDAIPPVKFFTKQQLIWVPFIGVAMYILGFPYVRRISREQRMQNPALANVDRDNTLAACDGFRTHPTAALNFLEGTRFTREKHDRQQRPAYTHLLNPRLGGLGHVLQGLAEELHCLVDVTIVYPQGVPTFWEFLKGECPRVEIHIESRRLPEDILDEETQRDALVPWVAAIWQEKDGRLDQTP
ncbi:MAG: acetyltransferase [Pseudomonadales bacterium]|jgi:1-acyl-sn-glycerol-3-phosphate acyltransferase|nr:acetyltransferase [Pseudomonadales bacterium]MDP6470917.1 acetyltransferase [Pseudomonadales bacterium]MDP6825898.1 acetyltransferase [Pseudomonadales bacterium]|tara:strand:+ start:340 stop:1206 length:867 start_codon:yes stop_codon:yes gene_type:complete